MLYEGAEDFEGKVDASSGVPSAEWQTVVGIQEDCFEEYGGLLQAPGCRDRAGREVEGELLDHCMQQAKVDGIERRHFGTVQQRDKNGL